MDFTLVIDDHGNEAGCLRHVRYVVNRDPNTGVKTHAEGYSASVLSRDNTGYLPVPRDADDVDGFVDYYTYRSDAEAAVRKARAAQRPPQLPKGLRLGSNQAFALYLANTTMTGRVDDPKIGAALTRKGLTAPGKWGEHVITDLGRTVVAELFDEHGNRL